MFICALALCIACVYCNDGVRALEVILRDRVCTCEYQNEDSLESGCCKIGGGCIIVEPAPPGKACNCKYEGYWTCSGAVTRCIDDNNYYCQHPDRSKQSCEQGGGDCGGYQ